METQTRNPILGRRPRVAVAVGLLAAWAIQAGCGGHPSTREPAPAPSLADVLEKMPPRAQLDTLRTLAKTDSNDATLPFHVGNVYYALGSALPPEQRNAAMALYDSAVTAYKHAVVLDSTYSRAYVNMGLTYDAAEKRNDARTAYRRALAVNPKDVLAYCHLGYLESFLGNTAEGVSLYEKALQVDPNSAQAHYNLGLAFAEARIFHEALREWETVSRLDPSGDLGKSAEENVRVLRQYLDGAP
jgi:tetratricopeptide (TPR) repeat protein